MFFFLIPHDSRSIRIGEKARIWPKREIFILAFYGISENFEKLPQRIIFMSKLRRYRFLMRLIQMKSSVELLRIESTRKTSFHFVAKFEEAICDILLKRDVRRIRERVLKTGSNLNSSH